ncbi:MAG: DUF3822 family protein [Bacteroidetes bacterium]|nr:DUF3822 family protein [Bacteroidota bacterium]
MKASFNIPVSGDVSKQDLLIEISEHGCFLLWFTRTPFTVTGLSLYHFSTLPAAEDILKILDEQGSNSINAGTVTITYDYKHSVLIPSAFHQKQISEAAISLLYGNCENFAYNQDSITSAEIYNHYRVPEAVASLVEKKFPKSTVFHSTSLQLELFNNEKDLLYCIFFQSSLKIILIKDSVLQLVQQYNYSLPVDAAYHLLNACEQFDVRPSEIPLRLCGMIEEKSKLYAEIHNYFLDINFDSPADTKFANDELSALPLHFFSHLTRLASCVS